MSFNYIGSKKSLIDFLDIPIKKIVESNKTKIKFLDGFAGTGIVGSSFHSKYNFNIISNDLEYYSYIINYSLLCVEYSDKLNDIILKLNNNINNKLWSVSLTHTLISTNYSPKGEMKRMYWTTENAEKCDYIMEQLDIMLNKTIDNNMYIYLKGCLLAAMDEVANTACVYGAYLKKFKKSALKSLTLKPLHTNKKMNSNEIGYEIGNELGNEIDNEIDNIIYNNDINSDTILNQTYDICYLDPPYNERQYSSNYHPLNYIAMYDSNITIYGKTGLIKDYNKSKYCNKSALLTLTELITKLKTKHILLSYNNEGIIDIEKIKTLLLNEGDVILYKKIYKKFKSEKKIVEIVEDKISLDKVTTVYEYLFHCTKKISKISSITKDNKYSEIIIS